LGALTITDDPITSSRVARAWRELEHCARSPFETWTWVSALAAMPAPSERVLTAWLGDQPVATLALERGVGPAGMRRIGLAGSSWFAPDHTDVLAEPTWAACAAHAFISHLRATPGWDLLEFDGLRADGNLTAALDLLKGTRLRRLESEDVLCPYVVLAGRAGTEAGFSHNLRSQLRRGLRSLEREGGAFDVVTAPDQVRAAMGTLIDLHNLRFGAQSQVFNSAERRRFHVQVSGDLAARGMARIYRLNDGTRDTALLYALQFEDRAYYYSMGLRTDGRGSPGLTLLGNAILMGAQDGLVEFDLLRGEHEFKLRFASDVRADLRRRILRVTPHSAGRAVGHLVRRRFQDRGAS
jgi:CelD/BcsL family acetyltransferase involved in cellulose biosynthesis